MLCVLRIFFFNWRLVFLAMPRMAGWLKYTIRWEFLKFGPNRLKLFSEYNTRRKLKSVDVWLSRKRNTTILGVNYKHKILSQFPR